MFRSLVAAALVALVCALPARAAPAADVAAVQVGLRTLGLYDGLLDGVPGPRTQAAVRGFQRFAGLRVDGIPGPATLAALRRAPAACPIRLRPPVDAFAGGDFGPRGDRFHTGLDFLAPAGRPVVAAAPGRVAFAGVQPGGWGILVVVVHGSGVQTLYAHLSRAHVGVGQRVDAGARIGAVGATGNATGPHLHFEVRLRGAALDPAAALLR